MPKHRHLLEFFSTLGLLTLWAGNASAQTPPAVSPDIVIDPHRSGPGGGDFADVAFDGTNFFVAYQSGAVERVSPAGVVLDTLSHTLISGLPTATGAPHVACGAGVCLLVADDGATVWGARIAADGTEIDTSPVAVATGSLQGANVAFDGTNFLVVYSANNGGVTGILGRRMAPSGAFVDAQPFVIASGAAFTYPDVAFDGTNVAVVWTLNPSLGPGAGTVQMARVHDNYRVDSADFTVDATNTPKGDPSVAVDPGGYLVTWTQLDSQQRGHARAISVRAGTGGLSLTGSGGTFGSRVAYNGRPAVAFDGTNYLVAWAGMQGERFSTSGAPVDSAVATLSPSGAGLFRNPGLGFGGGVYLLAATLENGQSSAPVQGTRVQPNLTVADTSVFTISLRSLPYTSPALASDGTNFVAAWSQSTTDASLPPPSGVFAAHIDAAGTVGAPGRITVRSGFSAPWVSVASNGNGYLVVWTDQRSGIMQTNAARLDANGAVLDATDIALSNGTGGETAGAPVVGSNGTDYLVAYPVNIVGSGGSRQFALLGERVSGAGVVLDPTPLAIVPPASGSATVTPFDRLTIRSAGGDYFVAWALSGVRGTAVTSGGAVANPGGAVLVANGGGHTLASNASEYLLTWEISLGPGMIEPRYSLLSTAGVLADPAGRTLVAPGDVYGAPSGEMQSASGNGGWLITYNLWATSTTLERAYTALDATGAVGGTARVPFTGDPGVFALAGTNAGPYLEAFARPNAVNATYSDLVGRLIDATPSTPDAGVPPSDAGGSDVVVVADADVDAGESDVVVADAGERDAGVDAGLADTGSDAVAANDAARDASTTDSASADAGGTTDAGTLSDARDEATDGSRGGCSASCTAGRRSRDRDGATAALTLASVALAATRRRRRSPA